MANDTITVTDEQLSLQVHRAVTQALSDIKGLNGEDAQKILRAGDAEANKFDTVMRLFNHNGFLNSSDASKFSSGKEAWDNRVTYNQLCDALSTTHFNHLIPRAISTIVREAIEPELSLTKLLRPIRFSAGTHAVFPAVSAMNGVEVMGEASEYPELQSPKMSGTVTVHLDKVGCSIHVTEEVLRYSQWDLISMMIRGAGRAMARFKEERVANLILNNAVLSYDNDTPGSAAHGSTTGRALSGSFNNTLRLDDLFVVYADMVNDGFLPNTLLMNALGWLIFARDPSMRAFAFANGGPLFRTVQGKGGNDPAWDPHLTTRASSTNLSYSSTQYVDVPNLFPVPLAIIVSPQITHGSGKTDMVMCDREELGLMLVDEEPMTEQFDDPKRDIRVIKFRERYGLALLNEGYAARKIANISTARGHDFEDTKTGWDLATAALPT